MLQARGLERGFGKRKREGRCGRRTSRRSDADTARHYESQPADEFLHFGGGFSVQGFQNNDRRLNVAFFYGLARARQNGIRGHIVAFGVNAADNDQFV